MKVHFEPYLYLAGLTHKSALIAWGGFYFKVARDEDGPGSSSTTATSTRVHPPRSSSIGANSDPYGHARVEVLRRGGRAWSRCGETTHRQPLLGGRAWSRTRVYTYRVLRERPTSGRPGRGATGSSAEARRAGAWWRSGRVYDNRFRTQPAPGAPARRSPSPPSATSAPACASPRRRTAGSARWRRRSRRRWTAHDVRLHPHHRRQHLRGPHAPRRARSAPPGDEDDDWFFTFYQPYRYLLNRIPVYPCIGNHDGDETEVNDDRDQIMDNFYLAERLPGEEAAGRASVGPGPLLPLPLRLATIELVCLDSSRRFLLFGERFFRHPNHAPFLEAAFPRRARGAPALAHPVRAPPAVLRGADVRELEVEHRAPRAALPAQRACGWC